MRKGVVGLLHAGPVPRRWHGGHGCSVVRICWRRLLAPLGPGLLYQLSIQQGERDVVNDLSGPTIRGAHRQHAAHLLEVQIYDAVRIDGHNAQADASAGGERGHTKRSQPPTRGGALLLSGRARILRSRGSSLRSRQHGLCMLGCGPSDWDGSDSALWCCWGCPSCCSRRRCRLHGACLLPSALVLSPPPCTSNVWGFIGRMPSSKARVHFARVQHRLCLSHIDLDGPSLVVLFEAERRVLRGRRVHGAVHDQDWLLRRVS